MIAAMALTIRAAGVVDDDGRAIQALMVAGYSSREVMAHLDDAMVLARISQAAS